MVKIELKNPHWLTDDKPDDGSDQCVHGSIVFKVNDLVICSQEYGDWTATAASLFLLRTLEEGHSRKSSVCEENYLIPCCGFSVWPEENSKYSFIVIGCNNGIDPEIEHCDENIIISYKLASEIVPFTEWVEAVYNFADQVMSFYESSIPRKRLDGIDKKGWDLFWSDWKRLRDKFKKPNNQI